MSQENLSAVLEQHRKIQKQTKKATRLDGNIAVAKVWPSEWESAFSHNRYAKV
jgi:hypothetical protein